MIALAWRTARARKAALAGSFIALALGVALLAAMALTLASTVGATGQPRWYTRPDVVVAGTNVISVARGSGDNRETQTVRPAHARAIPPVLARQLSALNAQMTVDYAASATAAGAPGGTLHPWSAAALHDYAWAAGGPPADAGQIVLTAPSRYRPGDGVTVQTVAGPRRFTVSGVIRTTAPAALYATDKVAASLARGRIGAVALTARPGEVVASLAGQARAASQGQAVQVLTGDQRGFAEPNPDGDLLAAAVALLGATSGLAGFVSAFVVAGTFAYAVAARRREFGLLRAAGAKPRQVRLLVLGEAVMVGLLGSLAGGALGAVAAGPFARWLGRTGLAPASFTAHFILWPVAAAFGAGMLIALAGAWIAARRAARVRPAEALREAAVDRKTMPVIRWLAGLASLGGAVPVLAATAGSHSSSAAALFLPDAMLLTLGFAMLAPVLIPPLVRLLTLPLAAARGATGMLASRSAVAAVRRTAATAAPVLLTVGIAGSVLAATDTLNRTQQGAAADRITAPAMAVPSPGTPGLADSTVAAIRSAPGVAAAVPASDTPVYVNSGGSPEQWSGRYIDGPQASRVLRLPVRAGDLAQLTGTGTVAVPAGRWRLGQTADIWLDDSVQVRLRVVAVFAGQLDLDQTVLLPWALRNAHTAAPVASAVYLVPGRGWRPGAAVRAAAAGGGTVIKTSGYISAADAQQAHLNDMALIAVLGTALAYTGIAIANTLMMAIADRRRELATLRLTGATYGQVLRIIGAEACLVTGIGVAMAAAVTAVTMATLRHMLSGLAPSVDLVIPWRTAGGIALACLLVALLASLIPAALTLRRRPAALAAIPQ